VCGGVAADEDPAEIELKVGARRSVFGGLRWNRCGLRAA